MTKLIPAWSPIGVNEILKGDNFYISYNPNTKEGHMAGFLTDLGNALGGNLKDGEETALVQKLPEGRAKFFILEGDFRKEYEEVFAKGFDACMEVYNRNKDQHRSNWSDD